MSEENTQPSEYRARPLEVGIVEQLKKIQPDQRVVVQAKNIFKSLTVQINGVLFIAATIVSLLDIVMGANIIEPMVKVFTSDPEVATRVITTVTQIYSALNILLRLKTNQPVTLRTDKKE